MGASAPAAGGNHHTGGRLDGRDVLRRLVLLERFGTLARLERELLYVPTPIDLIRVLDYDPEVIRQRRRTLLGGE